MSFCGPDVGQRKFLSSKLANTTLFIQIINVKMNPSNCVSAKRQNSGVLEVSTFTFIQVKCLYFLLCHFMPGQGIDEECDLQN